MNQRNASMTVIGAGSYGTALAITLARNGHEVVLWGHDPEHIATLERDRCNAAFLPDVPFPDTLHLESDLATALAASRNILVVVPSRSVPARTAPLLPSPWQEMATRLSSGAMTLNISQRLNATAVTPRFSPMCLFPIRSILKAISPLRWQPAVIFSSSYPAMSLVKCCARLNR